MKSKLLVVLITVFFLTSCKDNKNQVIKQSNSNLVDTIDKKQNLSNTIQTEKINSLKNNQTDLIIDKVFFGKYSIGVETEETTNGTAIINYMFEIFDDNVFLKIDTLHEPIRCGGQYDFKMKDGILQLFYAGIDESCYRDLPSFEIKSENNKLFIKGVGGEGTNKLWLELFPS